MKSKSNVPAKRQLSLDQLGWGSQPSSSKRTIRQRPGKEEMKEWEGVLGEEDQERGGWEDMTVEGQEGTIVDDEGDMGMKYQEIKEEGGGAENIESRENRKSQNQDDKAAKRERKADGLHFDSTNLAKGTSIGPDKGDETTEDGFSMGVAIFQNTKLTAFRERLLKYREVDARVYFGSYRPATSVLCIFTRTLPHPDLPPRLRKSLEDIQDLPIKPVERTILGEVMAKLPGYGKASAKNPEKTVHRFLQKLELRRAISALTGGENRWS